MNRDDIIQMAREASGGPTPPDFLIPVFERFYNIAASAERERFADECIDLVASYGGPVDLEAAIRARGQA
jgi:hypothetical protein